MALQRTTQIPLMSDCQPMLLPHQEAPKYRPSSLRMIVVRGKLVFISTLEEFFSLKEPLHKFYYEEKKTSAKYHITS